MSPRVKSPIRTAFKIIVYFSLLSGVVLSAGNGLENQGIWARTNIPQLCSAMVQAMRYRTHLRKIDDPVRLEKCVFGECWKNTINVMESLRSVEEVRDWKLQVLVLKSFKHQSYHTLLRYGDYIWDTNSATKSSWTDRYLVRPSKIQQYFTEGHSPETNKEAIVLEVSALQFKDRPFYFIEKPDAESIPLKDFITNLDAEE